MVFQKLKRIRDFERRHLAFLQHAEDRDLVISIGHAQEMGRSLNFKQLVLLEIGAPTTLQRRLNRLLQLGVLEKSNHASDRRSSVYTVATSYQKLFRRYLAVMGAVDSIGEKN